MADMKVLDRTLLPQIRLRTIFVLFFCAAVGLATSRDLLGALGPTIATAIVIGLWQQRRDLRQSRSLMDASSDSVAFAHKFATSWRCWIAGIMGACVIASLVQQTLVAQIEIEHRGMLDFNTFKMILPAETICIIIVVCNSVIRWRRELHDKSKPSIWSALVWMISVLIATMVVLDRGLLVFLYHRALAGIEASRPQFRRPGVYIDLRDQGYLSVWFAGAAVFALIAGGIMLIRHVCKRKPRSASVLELVVSVLLLAIPIAFCSWYYSTGFYHISPELGAAGMEASWLDWLVGLLLSLMLIVAGAYRIARCSQLTTTISSDISRDIDTTAIHESAPCLFLIGANAVYSLGVCATQIESINSAFGRRTLLEYVSMLWYPETLLILAMATASVQLCWVRWRRRNDVVEWKLRGVSRSTFYQSCFAIALLLLVGIPTLNAISFIAWLGPWDLMHLFGY